VAHEPRRDPGVLDSYLDPWRSDPEAFFRAAAGIEGKGLAGREEELRQLDVPVFLVWGEDDPFAPSELAERLQEALPGSALALLPRTRWTPRWTIARSPAPRPRRWKARRSSCWRRWPTRWPAPCISTRASEGPR